MTKNDDSAHGPEESLTSCGGVLTVPVYTSVTAQLRGDAERLRVHLSDDENPRGPLWIEQLSTITIRHAERLADDIEQDRRRSAIEVQDALEAIRIMFTALGVPILRSRLVREDD